MKTIFTFLFIFFIGFVTFAQKATSTYQKAGIIADKVMIDAQAFSIEKVYPNPVKDLLTIDLRSAVSGSIEVSLINILGSEVKRWDQFSLSKGDQKLKLDLSQFKSGMYILKITQQGQARTQILKKN